MKKIGIFYAAKADKTSWVAEKIQKEFGIHGLQAGQQERQPLAAVPVQRRPVLAGKSVKISKKVDAAWDAASTFCGRKC